MVVKAKEMPKTLWHYTDTNGLLGILGSLLPSEDRCEDRDVDSLPDPVFWATDALYLNDAQEIVGGGAALSTTLKRGQGLAPGDEISTLADLWLVLAYASGLLDVEIEGPTEGPYIISFCTARDRLSMWRNYAGGDGFAIAIQRDALGDLGIESLKEITYIDTTVALEHVLPGALIKKQDNGHIKRCVTVDDLACLKHQSFEEEGEWRLIVPHGPDQHVKFRAGRFGLTPYVQVAIPRAAISEIMIGPGTGALADPTRQAAVRRLVDAAGLDVPVTVTKSPFRG